MEMCSYTVSLLYILQSWRSGFYSLETVPKYRVVRNSADSDQTVHLRQSVSSG